jgi:hypothetical protein
MRLYEAGKLDRLRVPQIVNKPTYPLATPRYNIVYRCHQAESRYLLVAHRHFAVRLANVRFFFAPLSQAKPDTWTS